jgi:hypothetical protein
LNVTGPEEERVASIFRIEELPKQGASMKQIAMEGMLWFSGLNLG